jgi:hypothetical protein
MTAMANLPLQAPLLEGRNLHNTYHLGRGNTLRCAASTFRSGTARWSRSWALPDLAKALSCISWACSTLRI